MGESEKTGLFNLAKRVWAVPLAADALLTSVVTTKQLWQGEAVLIALTIPGLGVATLLTLLGYASFARMRDPGRAGFAGVPPRRTYR
jgi:hypothetical protein